MAEGQSGAEEGAGSTAWKKKHQDVETQNLEKVTDYVEEAGNSEELGKAMSLLESDMKKKNEAKAKREQELAKVVINKVDVELIMTELDVSKTIAERSLREHNGDLIRTLHTLTC